MEIGKHLDFHNSSNDGVDYAVRLQCQGNDQVIVNLPTSGGTLALTSELTCSNIGALPINTSGGIASSSGSGSYLYFKIVTISTANAYINHPIVLEISQRGTQLSVLQIEFNNSDSADPGLSFFRSNNDTCYYIKRVAASKWEVYGQYTESWGNASLHRITGTGASLVSAINMENMSSLPSDVTQCTISWAHSHSFSQITDGTSSSTNSSWSHILSNTYGGSQKSILYMCHGGGYGMHLRGYSTSSSVYMLQIYNSSKEVFGVYGDGHSVFGGNVTGTNFYTTSDRNKKINISSFSEHIRKFQLKNAEKWHYGVIAQEVEEIFRDGEEGNYTVNYNSILSYYIGILENKVQKLEDELKELKNQMNNG